MKDNMDSFFKFFIKSITIIVLLKSIAFAFVIGSIVDKISLKPILNATVSDSNKSVKTDKNGIFNLDSEEELFHIKAIGYKRFSFKKDFNTKIIKLEPIVIKALYLSFWHTSVNSSRRKQLIEIIDKTEVNAIVMDVKNEYGSTSYKTSVEKANSYGAYKKRTNRDIKEFIQLMKEKNIYTIARIVTFKDELQASNNQDYAIKKQDGSIWRNHDDMAWVDPFDKRSHDYTIAIAEDAAKVGFDEINFDYIRFPAKKDLKLSKENTQENRLKAIEGFLKSAQSKLRPYGVFISVDTYGNICWVKNDVGIGQKIESLAKYADYLAPMLYPSGFAKGSFRFKNPSEHPYEVIFRSVSKTKLLIDSKRVRPWLQYFKDYAHSKKRYRKLEINAQMRATCDTKTNGWMMWSPSSRYHLNYFAQEHE